METLTEGDKYEIIIVTAARLKGNETDKTVKLEGELGGTYFAAHSFIWSRLILDNSYVQPFALQWRFKDQHVSPFEPSLQ